MDFHQYSKKYQDDEFFKEEIVEQSMDDCFIEKIELDDKQLIEEVKSHSCIYKNERKKNKNEINQAWLNVAQVLNSKVEDCQHRWKILRQRYCKQRQLRESKRLYYDGPEKLSLYHLMSWIDPYVPRRKKAKQKDCTDQKNSNATISNVNKSMLDFTNSINTRQLNVAEPLIVLNSESIETISQPGSSQNTDSTNNKAATCGSSTDFTTEKHSCMTQNTTEQDDSCLIDELTATTNFTISSAEEQTTSTSNTVALDINSTAEFDNSNVTEVIPHTSVSTASNNDISFSKSSTINKKETEELHEKCRNSLADITSKINNALDSKFTQKVYKSEKIFDTVGELVEDTLRNIEDQTKKKLVKQNIMKILYEDE